MHPLIILGTVMVTMLATVDFLGVEGKVGAAYCAIRHPVERTCEMQHVIQQQSNPELLDLHDIGGSWGPQRKHRDRKNIIFINTVEHSYADRSKDRPWQKSEGSLIPPYFADVHLYQAYKMAVYANGYHFMLYDYRTAEGKLTLFEWDGASHFTYMIGGLANFITKEMSYIGYQFERLNDGKKTQFIDAILGIAIDAAEMAVGLGYGSIGVVVGSIWNPWDTLWNLPGALALSLQAVLVGVWNTLADMISLFTLGLIELQTAAW